MHSATSTDDHPLADPHLNAIALQDASIVAALLGSGLDDSRKVIGSLIERVGALPQVDMPVTHHFAPHVYGRECFIPKGTVAVGKIHRTQHLSVMLRGDMTFLTNRGLQRISGSCVMPLADPFTQRAVYAHEDTVLLTIHPTDSADLAQIEGEVIAPDWSEVDALDVESFVSEMLAQEGETA